MRVKAVIGIVLACLLMYIRSVHSQIHIRSFESNRPELICACRPVIGSNPDPAHISYTYADDIQKNMIEGIPLFYDTKLEYQGPLNTEICGSDTYNPDVPIGAILISIVEGYVRESDELIMLPNPLFDNFQRDQATPATISLIVMNPMGVNLSSVLDTMSYVRLVVRPINGQSEVSTGERKISISFSTTNGCKTNSVMMKVAIVEREPSNSDPSPPVGEEPDQNEDRSENGLRVAKAMGNVMYTVGAIILMILFTFSKNH